MGCVVPFWGGSAASIERVFAFFCFGRYLLGRSLGQFWDRLGCGFTLSWLHVLGEGEGIGALAEMYGGLAQLPWRRGVASVQVLP